jgi:2-oxoglutarate ferredoxin oxidoreductase subunit gamma
MGFRYEIRLAGSGGQGLILAGKILAEAAAIYDDKNATQSQSYGPEARGGASKSEVIISDEEIDYPKVTEVDLFMALTQESCDSYNKDLKSDGVLLVDSTYVTRLPEGDFKVYKLPITDLALEHVGNRTVTNIVALGVVVALSKVVSTQAGEAAILSRVPKGTEEMNKKAFKVGLEAAKAL